MIQSIDSFFATSTLNRVYGISRSLLAFGLLLSLLFTPVEYLFDQQLFQTGIQGKLIDDINFFFLFGYDNLFYSKIVSLLILVIVCLGFYPRFTGVLHWWIAFSFLNAATIIEGGEQIASILCLLLIPVTLTDNRKNHFFTENIEPSILKGYIRNLFLRVLIPMQMCIVYLNAGIHKIYQSEEWRSGTAIYYFSGDPVFGSDFLHKIASTDLVFILSWGAIVLEIILALALFMSYDNKKYLVILALIFHFLISIYFGLISFMFSMFCGIIIYLVNPVRKDG